MAESFDSNASAPGKPMQSYDTYRCSEEADDAISDLSISAGFEVRVQKHPIDCHAEMASLTRNPNVGAVANFVGLVRRYGDQDDVVALEIEHYPKMTEQTLWSIVEEATARWDLQAVRIIHRVGQIALGETVVFVVTAAEHRAAAFTACEFLVDVLKNHAPFWKKEIGRDGSTRWVKAKPRDERAMNRWG